MNATSTAIPAKSGAADWLRQHQLAAFFALTFLFSWTIYLLMALLSPQDSAVRSRMALVAGFGPSLSAIVISAATSSRDQVISFRKQAALFVPALVVAAALECVDHLWWNHHVQAALIVLDVLLITLIAFVVSRLRSARKGVRDLVRAVTQWRVGLGWYVLALGLWPALVLAGNAAARWLAIGLPPSPTWPEVSIVPIVLESFSWFLLFGGPLSEEPGWRGYALPRLAKRFSPLVASVILGALWGLWHVPLHLMGMYYGGAMGALIRVQEIPRAILFTWLYNRTKGSLLLSILFHAAVNTTSLFLPRSFGLVLGLCTIVAVVVVIADKMWRRPPTIRPCQQGC
jgi:membrane protease YdiL (CAAX protease family)